MTFTAGLFDLAVLALPNDSLDAAHRFFADVRPTIVLPQIFAEALYQGDDPRGLFGEWHSSDRPPLQAGMYPVAASPFLDRAIARRARIRGRRNRGAVGLDFRHLAAVRARGFTARRRAYILALRSSPAFVCSTAFTRGRSCWRRRSASARSCSRCRGGRGSGREPVAAGVLAALALLAHGSAVFFLLPAAVVLRARGVYRSRAACAGGRRRRRAPAAVVGVPEVLRPAG